MSLGTAEQKHSEVLRCRTADPADLADAGLCSSSAHTPLITCIFSGTCWEQEASSPATCALLTWVWYSSLYQEFHRDLCVPSVFSQGSHWPEIPSAAPAPLGCSLVTGLSAKARRYCNPSEPEVRQVYYHLMVKQASPMRPHDSQTASDTKLPHFTPAGRNCGPPRPPFAG